VAIAYLLHKVPYVFPIIGCRKVEHLLSNIEALEIALSDEQMKELEGAVEFNIGFPGTMVVSSRPFGCRRPVCSLTFL
jgi:diketogulonate reductase-like aldo/keto reductase